LTLVPAPAGYKTFASAGRANQPASDGASSGAASACWRMRPSSPRGCVVMTPPT